MSATLKIETDRLVLRSWHDAHRAPFAAMLANPDVMERYPAPYTRAESDARFERYRDALDALGHGYFAVETKAGEFVGYAGIAPIPIWHRAVGEGVQIGWMLARPAWGRGYATEAARAALEHGFREHGFCEVLSYTDPTNTRSEAVMVRLGMQRQASRDFTYELDGIRYPNIVYAALPAV